MQPTRSRSRRTSAAERVGAESGHTLIELVIACSILLLVLGVIFSALDDVMNVQAYDSERTSSLDAMRTTLNTMTRELRQASSIDQTTSTASYISFDSYGRTGARHVVYNASGTLLTRQVNGGAAVTILTGLASTSLFTYVTAPPVPGAQWVQINVQVRPKHTPDTVLVLDSEVNLRNRTDALQ